MSTSKRSALSDARFGLAVVIAITTINMAIVGYPLYLSFATSFTNLAPLTHKNEFIGIDNYVNAWNDPRFTQSLFLTINFAAVSVVLTILLALSYGLLMNERFFGRGFFRAIVLLPWAVSEAVTGIIYGLIYNSQVGHLNGLIHVLGLTSAKIYWLSPENALNLTAVAFAWHWAPLGAFFFLAALQTVPEDQYKSAKIDGAGPIRRFLTVTVPSLRFAIVIVLVIITAQAFMEFDLVFAMTRGGPGISTLIYPLVLYRINFLLQQWGYATALSFILIAIVIVLSSAYFYLLSLGKTKSKAPKELGGRA